MAGNFKEATDAIVMDGNDHVATCLRDVIAGQTITYRAGERLVELKALSDIPFGHKISICPIAADTHVRKYGEVIGRATVAIEPGEHVHVHNLEGIRGRGDQAKGETA
jgi:altronate dehydratase small subunit